ncbi:MAG: WYL domain-containing protein [Acidimicrobiia bacterium]|nr:WYL domain-containing protein [Acidimicrobiia bacterium]
MSAASRLSAGQRLERLLSIVPWVAARDGASIEEIARRFDYPQERLLSDLQDVVFMVGLYPFTPDQLIEVMVDDGKVWIRYAEYFERALRLSPDQALALVAAGQSLLAVPGAEADGPLARGLAKLARSLGLEGGAAIDVRLGAAPADIIDSLRTAESTNTQVEIDYYAFGRDERSRRVVDPLRLFVEGGQWYLFAYCHQAEDERVFRVDRVNAVNPTGTTFVPPDRRPVPTVYRPRDDDARVTLRLSPDAAWVPEHYPCESVERDGDDLVVELAVTAVPWLERLLLRLGPAATIEAASAGIPADLARIAATRLLERYDRGVSRK